MGAADLVVAVRVALALLWWKLCHYVHHFLYVKSVAPRSQYFHKIAVIGDDFAAGVGDYVTITSSAGIAHYLPGILQRSDKVMAMGSSVSVLVAHAVAALCRSATVGRS